VSGIVQMPVALRIARHAAQVLRASGKFIREDRKDAEIAKQDAPRSLRLGELLLSIYQPRTAPTVPERAPTRVSQLGWAIRNTRPVPAAFWHLPSVSPQPSNVRRSGATAWKHDGFTS
jgi:hypothetical protein